jgi:hypothetical protein
MVYGK